MVRSGAGSTDTAVVPTVTIARHNDQNATVTEGEEVRFTLIAYPIPTATLTVNVSIGDSLQGGFLTGDIPDRIEITMGSTTADIILQTEDDSVDEANGIIAASVESGAGYRVGSSSLANVTVLDNDLLALIPPSNLTVTPMSLRRAELTWTGDDNANGYTLRVENPDGDHGTVGDISETRNVIHLDNILGSDGLAQQDYFKFQVKAKGRTGISSDSGYSEEILIIDTPITRVSGLTSTDEFGSVTGIAFLEAPIFEMLGDGYEYHYDDENKEWVTILYRKQIDSLRTEDDSSEEMYALAGDHEYELDELEIGQVYAIQFTLQIPPRRSTTTVKVFGARYSYVWPSGTGVFGLGLTEVREHFEFYGFWQPETIGGESNVIEYRYKICQNTFRSNRADKTINGERFSALIQHAFEQWEIASSRLVRMTLADLYRGGTETTDDHCDKANANIPFALIESGANEVFLVENLNIREEFGAYYTPKCENGSVSCLFVSTITGEVPSLTTTFKPEGGRIRVRRSVGGRATAIVISEADLVISRAVIDEMDLDPHMPGSVNSFDPDNMNAEDLRFNTCKIGPEDSDFIIYETMVHESGHALGIIRSATQQSVMYHGDYDNGRWNHCSPHPIDIMGVYAIYQTLGPTSIVLNDP